jgi:glycosyltransferase involved in cell wall biosynthesis
LLHVLAIGLDKDLLAGRDTPVLRRQRLYAARLGWLGMIVFSGKGHPERIQHAPNFEAFATNSVRKPLCVPDAARIGVHLCRSRRVDVIVTQDPFATGLAGYAVKRLCGVPLVVHYHADFWGNRYWLAERPLNRCYDLIGRYVTRRADGIRVVSTRIRRALIAAGIEAARIVYASPPVEEDRLLARDPAREEALRRRLGLNGCPVLLYAGRLVPQKNLPLLIEAMRLVVERLPQVKLLMVGGGAERPHLEGFIKARGLTGHVILLPGLPYDELASVFHLASVFALPSNYEGMPKVLKEAAICGLPAVVTDISGADDLVIDGVSGYIVPPGDARSFAGRLLDLLGDPSRCRRMGEAARRHVLGRFGYERDIDGVVAGWQRLAGLSGGGP